MVTSQTLLSIGTEERMDVGEHQFENPSGYTHDLTWYWG